MIFTFFCRDDLDRFRRSQSGPVPYSALGTRHGSSSPPPFTSSPRLNDFSGSFDLAVRPRTQGDRPRTQQSSSSFGRPDAAQSRSRSPSPRKMNAAMGGSNGNLVANWTRDLTNELLAASEGVSKGTAVSKPFKMRSVQVPLRSIATPNHRGSPPPHTHTPPCLHPSSSYSPLPCFQHPLIFWALARLRVRLRNLLIKKCGETVKRFPALLLGQLRRSYCQAALAGTIARQQSE